MREVAEGAKVWGVVEFKFHRQRPFTLGAHQALWHSNSDQWLRPKAGEKSPSELLIWITVHWTRLSGCRTLNYPWVLNDLRQSDPIDWRLKRQKHGVKAPQKWGTLQGWPRRRLYKLKEASLIIAVCKKVGVGPLCTTQSSGPRTAKTGCELFLCT